MTAIDEISGENKQQHATTHSLFSILSVALNFRFFLQKNNNNWCLVVCNFHPINYFNLSALRNYKSKKFNDRAFSSSDDCYTHNMRNLS